MSSILSWLGIWALATGWLLLSDFFLAPDVRGWAFAGAGLLLQLVAARRVRWQRIDPWLYLLAVPLAVAALIWPMPIKVGPILILAAFLLSLPLRRANWLAPVVLGLGVAGTVWVAQSGSVVAYWWLGARYHDVGFLAPIVKAMAELLGWTVGSSGGTLFIPHVDEMLQATATWERLGAFPIMLLCAGGLALSPLVHWGTAKRSIGRVAAALALIAGYAMLRYLILTGVLAITLKANIFWLPLPVALTFLPLSFLLARVLPLRMSVPEPFSSTRQPAGRIAAVAGLAFLAGLCLIGLLTFPDPGRRKTGRVLLDEYNSNWEWTTQVLDTEWYGQKSGYNYYSLGQWLQYYYEVDTNFEPRTPELLSGYDVLIIKTPTAPFTPEELDAIEAWVKAGGGLFLIGDHTNVFGTSSYLNPLARRFGLRFRYDSTYDLATMRVTLYERPDLLAHPAVVDMPPFLFATSCTLEAPLLAENVMVGYGLRALSVDYSKRVFFPDKEKINDYPFGLFLQSAAVVHGRGRVVAFTDSTVFSNFTMFIPGKPEYFLGVMNWLNYSERWPWLDWALWVIALLTTAGAAYLARSMNKLRVGTAIVGALLLAAALGPWLSVQLAETVYALPEPHTDYTVIAFDEEHSRLTLPTYVATSQPQASYQTFYVWTQRLGYVPRLTPSLEGALEQGDVVVVVDPFQAFDEAEVAAVKDYVSNGGRLLVLTTPRDSDRFPNYANQLLEPFGLGVEARAATFGMAHNADGEVLGEIQVSGVVTGGDPLLTLEGQAPIMSLARDGDGLVVAASFSQPFTDQSMGTTSVLPDANQRVLFEIEYWLMRGLVTGDLSPLQFTTE